MVRAFIAVDISQEARAALAGVAERLQQQGVSGVRWVRPEGIHLTLKFLGEIDTDLVGKILEAMERAVDGTMPLTLALSEPGAFPNANSPRVIWVGLQGRPGPLERAPEPDRPGGASDRRLSQGDQSLRTSPHPGQDAGERF